MTQLSELIETLRQKGFKATAQRIEILNVLSESKSHPTAEEVEHIVRRKFPTISPATIYNTIQVLKKAGRVQELAFYDKKTRFDANMRPHINMVCLNCDKIEDVIDPKLEEFVKESSERRGFKLQGQRLDYYGLCGECAARRGSNT